MSRVSVIIPAKNAERFIGDALDSVLWQEFDGSTEVIVVDDGSKDRTAQIAARRGARVLDGRGRGVSAARNLGVRHSTGDFMAFLDADDVWSEGKLARQHDYLRRNAAVGLVGSGCELFGAAEPRVLRLNDDDLRQLEPMDFLATCRMYPSSFLVRADVARHVEFPEGLGDAEDLVYLACMRRFAQIGAVGDPLFRRRVHPEQVTCGRGHLARALRGRLDWARRHWAELGLTDVRRAERAIVDAIVNDVWIDYWFGNFERFHQARQELVAGWPAGLDVPPALTRRVLPTWLVRAKRAAEHVLGRTA